MRPARSVFLLFSLFLAFPALASRGVLNCPAAIVGPSRIGYSPSEQRPGFILDVSADESVADGFPDFFVLRLETNERNPRHIGQLKFSSTYGRFQVCLVDVTGDGIEEILLVTGAGRGTSVRWETLTVWQRVDSSFRVLLREQISDWFAVEKEWWYRVEVVDVNHDGVSDLRFDLGYDSPDGGTLSDSKLIPRDKLRLFVFDRKQSRMIRYQP